MLDHMQRRIQARNAIALYFILACERFVGKSRNHAARIPDGSPQLGNELSPGNRAALRKLAIALPPVFRFAQPRNNPLPNISA